MTASRWQFPAAPQRVSVILTLAVGLIGLIALALIARQTLSLTAWYVIKATALYLVIGVIALLHVAEYHPFRGFGLPNQITTERAVLAVMVASLTGEPHSSAVAMAAVAGGLIALALDGIDGWIARRTRTTSAFGAGYDVEVDSLLNLALAILVWRYEKAGAWVLLSGLLRYIFVGAGWLVPWIRAPLPSSMRGKVICVIQIVALIVLMVPWVAPPLSTAIAASALATLVYSFFIDVRWLWQRRFDAIRG
jgi:phosphatidylglycerophosphate synthase